MHIYLCVDQHSKHCNHTPPQKFVETVKSNFPIFHVSEIELFSMCSKLGFIERGCKAVQPIATQGERDCTR